MCVLILGGVPKWRQIGASLFSPPHLPTSGVCKAQKWLVVGLAIHTLCDVNFSPAHTRNSAIVQFKNWHITAELILSQAQTSRPPCGHLGTRISWCKYVFFFCGCSPVLLNWPVFFYGPYAWLWMGCRQCLVAQKDGTYKTRNWWNLLFIAPPVIDISGLMMVCAYNRHTCNTHTISSV